MHAHTDHMQNIIGCQATISKVARAVFRKALTDGSAVRNAAKKDQASPYIHKLLIEWHIIVHVLHYKFQSYFRQLKPTKRH